MSIISQTQVGWIPEQDLHDINQPLPIDPETGEPTQTAIPLIKEEKPQEPFGQTADSFLEWTETEVTRKWTLRNWTAAERDARYPDAESWRVKQWLLETQGIARDHVMQILESAIPDAGERAAAIQRYDIVPIVPFSHPLTQLLAQAFGIDLATAWPAILVYR